MLFYVRRFKQGPPSNADFPCLVLIKDGWNDFRYYTLFRLHYYQDLDRQTEIGYLKILQKDAKSTELPTSFDQLSNQFCSLGTDLEYYKKIKEVLEDHGREVLSSLNDCAIDRDIRRRFEKLPGFNTSLLRSSDSEKALEQAQDVLAGLSSAYNFDFEFSCKLRGADEKHSVHIDFGSLHHAIPSRVFCLIGKNGTGKTQFLAKLALGLSGHRTLRNSFRPGRPLFSKTIFVSYSCFDEIERPIPSDKFSYFYCGFRDQRGTINKNEFQKMLIADIRKIMGSSDKIEQWVSILSPIIEAENLRDVLRDLESGRAVSLYEKLDLGSGQNIIFSFVSQILGNITKDSLILFDEPEMHLHPNAISQLIRILYELLTKTESYAIVATHSPIIIQQIPSKYVRVFERLGNIPLVREIQIESFGENLTSITDEIFGNIDEEDYYKTVLRQLRQEFGPRFLNQIFDGRLSFNAKVFFESTKD